MATEEFMTWQDFQEIADNVQDENFDDDYEEFKRNILWQE